MTFSILELSSLLGISLYMLGFISNLRLHHNLEYLLLDCSKILSYGAEFYPLKHSSFRLFVNFRERQIFYKMYILGDLSRFYSRLTIIDD